MKIPGYIPKYVENLKTEGSFILLSLQDILGEGRQKPHQTIRNNIGSHVRTEGICGVFREAGPELGTEVQPRPAFWMSHSFPQLL